MDTSRESMLAWEKARWDEAAARSYDTPGEGMFDPGLLEDTSSLLCELAGKGPALELGVGTGRVALPLIQRGISVSGIELSPHMIARLKQKPLLQSMKVYEGDMATTTVPGRFSLVYIVYNTLSNLLTQEQQVDCFHNAARHLETGGHFLVEMWLPQVAGLAPGTDSLVTMSKEGYFCVDRYDILNQCLVSHHFYFDEGGQTRLIRSRHRYVWPAEMDLMAHQAGFTLKARYADWKKTAFHQGAASQIAVYEKTGQA